MHPVVSHLWVGIQHPNDLQHIGMPYPTKPNMVTVMTVIALDKLLAPVAVTGMGVLGFLE